MAFFGEVALARFITRTPSGSRSAGTAAAATRHNILLVEELLLAAEHGGTGKCREQIPRALRTGVVDVTQLPPASTRPLHWP